MECKAMCYALRGATTVKEDNPDLIIKAVGEMFLRLLEVNNLEEKELAYIHFSQTKDLRSLNAASALRKGGHGNSVPLFCTQEADVEGGLGMCIRVLVLVNHPEMQTAESVYMNGAENLRSRYGLQK